MSKSDIGDFVMQPLHKKLNKENLVSRMEKLEAGETAAAPSARVDALGEMGQSTGTLSIDELFILNHDTGLADITLNQYGILFRNQEGELIFQDSAGGSTVAMYIDGGNWLVAANQVGGVGISFLLDDVAHNVNQIDFDADGNINLFNGTYNIAGVPHTHAGGSAHTIEDEGTPLTARSKLNFVGAGVTVTDDSGDDASDVTIPGTTTEEIQDIVGAMVDGGTHSGITTSYNDAGGFENLSIDDQYLADAITDLAREKLSGVRTYYVRTDGADSNPGLTDSAAGAFLTIQKAVDVAAALDNGGFDITIQVRDGTYTGAVTLKTFVGSGTIIIRGNNGTPSNVLISTTSASCFAGTSVRGIYQILDLKMQTTTSGSCITGSGAPTQIAYGNVVFGASAGFHVNAERGAWTRAISSYSITGGAIRHWTAGSQGINEANVVTVTLTGTPAFTTFAVSLTDSIVRIVTSTFVGSATGQRYLADAGTIDATSTETYLPGDALGATTNGGRYGSFAGNSRTSAQFDKTNTTLANITGLTATLLAGRTYKFRAVLHTTSNVASGVKFAIAGTCTATAIIYEALVYNAAALAAQTRATALAGAVGGVTAVTVAMCIIEGVITVNAAGTLTVQFADNAGTNTSSVLIGSTFSVEDIT